MEMALGQTQATPTWEKNNKHFTDEQNMNSAFVTRFMWPILMKMLFKVFNINTNATQIDHCVISSTRF